MPLKDGKSYEKMSYQNLAKKFNDANTKGTPGALARAKVMGKVLEQKHASGGRPTKGSQEAKDRMAKVRSSRGVSKETKYVNALGYKDKTEFNEDKKEAKMSSKGHPHYLHHLGITSEELQTAEAIKASGVRRGTRMIGPKVNKNTGIHSPAPARELKPKKPTIKKMKTPTIIPAYSPDVISPVEFSVQNRPKVRRAPRVGGTIADLERRKRANK